MPSIFSRIISGEIPSYKIAEDDKFFAFLDIYPIARGHALVIPKKEVDYLFDLDDDLYKEMWIFAREVGKAIEKVVPCERMGLSVLGLEVPHAHIHLVPINTVYDIDFSKPKLKLSPEEFEELASKIREEYQKQD